MRGNYAVLGLGSFGSKLAIELSNAGNNVVVIDRDADQIQALKDDIPEIMDSLAVGEGRRCN